MLLTSENRSVVLGLTGVVLAVAMLDLAGWLLGIPILTSLLPHYATMKPNTAIALACVALSLPLTMSSVRWRALLANLVLLPAFVLSFGSLLEDLFHRSLGLDQLFIRVPADAYVDPAGRMSIATAFSLVLTTLAVYLLRRVPAATVIALLAGIFLSLSAIIGYLFHAGPVPGVPWFRSVALHTGLGLLLLQLAGLAARPEQEPMCSLLQPADARPRKTWLLLSITGVPVVISLPLLAGMRRGLFDPPFTMALLVVALIAIQTFLLWRDNKAMERMEALRLRTEQALFQTEKLAAVGRLSASIAHEINNPLEAVGNLLYLIGSSESLAEVARYTRTAEDELERVSQITTQTLSFYRDDRKKAVCNPRDIVDSAVELLRSKIQAAHVEVVTETKGASAEVRCKDGELRQVLINLISNAVEASPGGRLRIRTRLSHRWVGSYEAGIRVLVADNGSGIPAEARARIFEPFFTTKADTGNGLGLWIAHQLVEQHGGFLHMRSTTLEGRHGTVFLLFLPLSS